MALRVSGAYLLASTSLRGPLRVSGHWLSHAAQLRAPLRVSGHWLYGVMSTEDGFSLNLLDADNEIFGLDGYDLQLVSGPIPEFNPYKPQVPESLIDIGGREFFDYIEENQKTLREQHNVTQAGDTTFPHEMIINTHDKQEFTLGAVGRFYHKDYGIIHARYVQFEKMDAALIASAPVGLIKNTASLDWIVTNRLEISHADLVVGITASYTVPADEQFGWVVIDGVNLQPLIVEGTNTEIGRPYVWSASGKIGPGDSGVVVCRRLQDGGEQNLLRGRAHIRLEGSFVDTDKIAQLLADVVALQAAVGELEAVSDVSSAIAQINATLKTLKNLLTSETNSRRSGDTALSNRIEALGGVTLAELNSALSGLSSSINSTIAGLTSSLAATNATALEALNKANQALAMDLGAIQLQISSMLDTINVLNRRVKGRFPIVDGAVPPNLVYLDDGSLVYEETF